MTYDHATATPAETRAHAARERLTRHVSFP